MKFSLILIFLVGVTLNALTQDLVFLRKNSLVTSQDSSLIYIQGGLVALENATIMLNGSIKLGTNSFQQQGDWRDSTSQGAIDPSSSGTLHFVGNFPQHVQSAGSFSNLWINSEQEIILESDLIVLDTLHLTKGVIYTGAYKVHIMNANTDAILPDSTNLNYENSWINGNLKRQFISSEHTYTFPLGAEQGNKIEIINHLAEPLTGISSLTATFEAKNDPSLPISINEDGKTFTKVLSKGIWKIQSNTEPISGSFDIRLFLLEFTPIIDDNFIIVERNLISSNDADWNIPGGSAISEPLGEGRKSSDGYALRKNLSIFGQFGIAITNSALPVTFSTFTGRLQDKNVLLEWKTTFEKNASHFNVQRSVDGINFVTFSTSQAFNNGNDESSYTSIDPNVEQLGFNKIYYRIQQVDLDGTNQYTQIILIKILYEVRLISIYPNPSSQVIEISVPDNLITTDADLVISDAFGRIIWHQKILTARSIIDISRYPKGTYIATMRSGNTSISKRFIKL